MPILKAEQINQAVTALNNEDVVAIPTETVYGLAGRIDKPSALKKIFATKQRPFFDPLIVHVTGTEQAKKLTRHWPKLADELTKKFWPGPLTLVLPKGDVIDPMITSGLDSVGLRCPQHPVAQKILAKVGAALAAPSANLFGRTSPTSAQHVEREFSNSPILVVDGGPCQIGIESTVLKIEETPSETFLYILRKGMITQAQLEAALEKSDIKFSFKTATDKTSSPGHLDHHYRPSIPLIFCENNNLDPQQVLKQLETEKKIPAAKANIAKLELPADEKLAARTLYSEMRRLSEMNFEYLIFYKKDSQSSEAWTAILDRLYRASQFKVF